MRKAHYLQQISSVQIYFSLNIRSIHNFPVLECFNTTLNNINNHIIIINYSRIKAREIYQLYAISLNNNYQNVI